MEFSFAAFEVERAKNIEVRCCSLPPTLLFIFKFRELNSKSLEKSPEYRKGLFLLPLKTIESLQEQSNDFDFLRSIVRLNPWHRITKIIVQPAMTRNFTSRRLRQRRHRFQALSALFRATASQFHSCISAIPFRHRG